MHGRPIFIEFRRRRGQRLEYSLTRTIDQEHTRPHNPLMRLVGKKTASSSSQKVVRCKIIQNTADVSPDWVASLKCNVEEASLEINGEPAEFSREEDPVSTYLSLKMDRFGHIREISGTTPSFHQGVFTDADIKPGQSWQGEVPVMLPKLSTTGEVLKEMEIPVKYTYTLIDETEVKPYQCAQIQVDSAFEHNVNEQVRLRYYFQGTLLFAHRDGFLVSSSVRATTQILVGERVDTTSVTDQVQLLEETTEHTVGGMRF